MEKKLAQAVAISLVIIVTWQILLNKFYHVDNKHVKRDTLQAQIIKKSSPPPLLAPDSKELSADSLFRLPQDKYALVFNEGQGAVKEVFFSDHQNYKLDLKNAFALKDKGSVFIKDALTRDSISFIYHGQDKQITKRFIFSKSNYTIYLEIEIQNLSSKPLSLRLPISLGTLQFAGDQNQTRLQDVTVMTREKLLHPNARKEAVFDDVKFMGWRDRYFCLIVEPQSPGFSGFINKSSNQNYDIGLLAPEVNLASGQKIAYKFHIYLGPQMLRIINNVKPEWAAVMHYGTFDFVAQILLQLLDILHRIIPNWGLVIIALSIIIYIVLFPLSLKQMRSMKRMQELQPKIEELRNLYKDTPQKLNTEIMKLYKEYKVNPLSGCLPLLLQMPIFFALYQVLIRTVSLKGASFLWIKDLSEPDKLFVLPVSLPLLGSDINILPILMALTMFIQQKGTMAKTGGTTAEQQKLMLILFPLMFAFIFYHMPSGLVLYWFINSLLMLAYQFKINKQK